MSLTLPLLSLWLVQAAVGTVPVRGASACPLPVDVERALRPWVSEDEGRGLSAQVESSGQRVRLRLWDAKGALVGERFLESAAVSCEELAEASAVVLASWVGELRASQPGVPSAPDSGRRVAPPSGPRAPRPRYAFEVGAGMMASVAAGEVGWGAELGAAGTSLQRRWGGHVVLGFLGERPLPVNEGQLAYERYFLGLGPHRRLMLDTFRLDVGGELVGGLVNLSGDALAPGQDTLALALAVAGSARLVSEVGPWLGLRLLGWPERERVETGSGQGREVPRVELVVALGLSWGGR